MLVMQGRPLTVCEQLQERIDSVLYDYTCI